MIDYSVCMMSNPAKPNTPAKAYARAQIKEVISGDEFARHIAGHNGVFTRGTVKGILTDLTECLVEYILNGYKVTLGDLGSFSASLSSTGAASAKEFTAHHITAVNILFTPGPEMENLIGKATFNPVSTRAAQMATYKAERAGETTVDLEAAKKNPNTEAGKPTGPQVTPEPEDGGGDTGGTPGGGGDGEGGGLAG